jgi:hypothetical protein
MMNVSEAAITHVSKTGFHDMFKRNMNIIEIIYSSTIYRGVGGGGVVRLLSKRRSG